MSLLKSVLGAVGKVAGPILSLTNPLLGAAITTGASIISAPKPVSIQPASMFPSLPALGRAIMPGLGAVGSVAGAGMRGARAITRSAMTYCRRHPQWCGTIGGVAAVEALVGQGQLPVIKRSRGRGISASDLRKFKRVSKVLSRYCAPTKRAMRSPALRGKSCQ